MATSEYEFWDLGDEPSVTNQWPRYNDKCLARIMRALITTNGRWHACHIDTGSGFAAGKETFTARISLPAGRKEEFENLVGFPLTAPPTISL